MDKRERVMKGLECCSIGLYCPDEECPYEKDKEEKQENCIALLARDALEVLKAQEPRVMTLDEVEKADFVYIEQCGFIVPALRIPHLTLSTSLQFVYSFQGNTAIIDISPRAYNKALRCWTSRPTEEQRKAVKWDG